MELLAGLLAVLPVMVASAHAVDFRWTPSSDDGVIALRAFDVFSANPPLLGQWSQSSPLIHEPTYSLGPMLYWLLAIPARIDGIAVVLTMAAVNAACVVGSVLLAGRRGGIALALGTAGALALMCRSLPVEIPYEVWNCWAGVFPFTLLLFLAWSVACGDYRLLPLLALVGSYVLQVHFTYLLPGAAALLVGLVGMAVVRRRRPAGALRPWAIAALVVALVCWSAPLVEQVGNRPGNFVLALRLATDDHRTLGAAAGRYTTVRTIGVVPWWAERARTHPERVLEILRRPPALAIVSSTLVFGALLVLLAIAWRRRHHEAVTALALSLLLCVAVAAVAASIPANGVGLAAIGYVLTWTSPAGMWAWLIAVWSAAALVAPAHRRVAPPRLLRPVAAGAVAVLAVLVAAGRDYESSERLPPGVKDYRMIRAAAERVGDALSDSRGVLLDAPREVPLTFKSAATFALRRKGVSVYVPPRLSVQMGDQYARAGASYADVLSIRDGGVPAPARSHVIVRNEAVTISVARGGP